MSEHRPALVELRVLEGANLYFPRPAVKLTLDVSSLLDLDDDAARAVANALGMPSPGPGARATGLRQRFASRVVATSCARWPARPGTTRLAVRSRPDRRPAPARRRLSRGGTVAGPRRWPTPWRVLDAVPDVDGRVEAAAASFAALEPGRPAGAAPAARAGRRHHRHQRQDDDLAAGRADGPVRGAGGRLVVHRRRVRRRPAGRGRRLLRPERRRPGARRPDRPARGHRDRARRHPARGHRRHAQRRLGRHERVGRPPRAARRGHGRPARGGQGGRHPGHPEGRLGGAQRRRPPDLRHAAGRRRARLRLLPRPRLALAADRAQRGRSGGHPPRRGGHRPRPAAASPTRCPRSSTCR